VRSSCADNAVQSLKRLTRHAHNVKVVVVVCVYCDKQQATKQERDNAKKLLLDAYCALREDGKERDIDLVEVHTDNVATAICELAVHSGADMIVVGARGRSAVQGLLLGSVSQSLVVKSKTDVLVSKLTDAPACETFASDELRHGHPKIDVRNSYFESGYIGGELDRAL
jgi:nucleotide-binding universal stress UspA family protein